MNMQNKMMNDTVSPINELWDQIERDVTARAPLDANSILVMKNMFMSGANVVVGMLERGIADGLLDEVPLVLADMRIDLDQYKAIADSEFKDSAH